MQILIQAYASLERKGIDHDDLHFAVCQFLRSKGSIRNPCAYLKRVAFHHRLMRSRSTLPAIPEGALVSTEGPATQAIADESRLLAHRIVESLPWRERRVIELHFFDGIPYDQISEQLGCSTAAVRGLIFRALKRASRSLRNWNTE